MRIAIIASKFNGDITNRLLTGATLALQENGVKSFDVFEVPGAFEIPVMAKRLSKKYDGIIALGCVLRGETDHYAAVCAGVTYGIQKVAVETGKPVMFGVLMCRTKKQALARCGEKKNNKGFECGKGLLEVLGVRC